MTDSNFLNAAQSAPQSDLAGGLAKAFRSDDTPPFSNMVGSLFGNSDGQQKAGILNQLLGSVGPGVLASAGLSGLASLLGGGKPAVTAEQANSIPPAAVQQIAEHAEKENPSIIDRASEFYAQHPTLVQGLGATSLAMIMSHLSRK